MQYYSKLLIWPVGFSPVSIVWRHTQYTHINAQTTTNIYMANTNFCRDRGSNPRPARNSQCCAHCANLLSECGLKASRISLCLVNTNIKYSQYSENLSAILLHCGYENNNISEGNDWLYRLKGSREIVKKICAL